MKKYISAYVKNCVECNQYRPTNRKPAGLLRTPVYDKRFEVLVRWIFIVEDTNTRWVELFALNEATTVNFAKTLLEEVHLCYELPRRLISDNGPQFVSAILQQSSYLLGITQDVITFIPVMNVLFSL